MNMIRVLILSLLVSVLPLVVEARNRIVVSKKELTLSVMSESGDVLYSCGIACGAGRGPKLSQGDNRTPEGKFSIVCIHDSRKWLYDSGNGVKVPHVYGPFFMRLGCPTERWMSIGIHGTSSPRSIGSRCSHGCIRLNNRDLIEVVKFVEQGAECMILPD